MGLFSKTMKSIFLDDRAKRAGVHRVYAEAMTEQQKMISVRDDEIQRLREQVGEIASNERQELIQNAQKVRLDKAKMLDDLPEADKQKLRAIATKAMLGEGGDEGGSSGGKP